VASDGDTAFASLTPDARYVAFTSDADDLVPNDVNGADDAFLYDLETRELELLSNKHGTDETPMGHSYAPVLSDDARYVAFTAYTFELTSPPPLTGGLWVYLKDRQRGTIRRLPADYACAYWVDMSGDAAFIVAEGYTNCQGSVEDGDYDSSYEYDLFADGVRALGMQDGGDNYRPAISRDGRFIVWATRPPMSRGVLASQLQVFDREADGVETLSFLGFNYESTDISDAGNIIAFSENGQIYRYDRDSAEVTAVSRNPLGEIGNGTSYQVSLSGDGRYLVFMTSATNLVPGDTNDATDILLYDANDDSLERISTAPDGTEADGDTKRPFISGDGSKISFISKARNLLPAATTGNFQLYVLTRAPD
jgi:Tol biopolymer transport system component